MVLTINDNPCNALQNLRVNNPLKTVIGHQF